MVTSRKLSVFVGSTFRDFEGPRQEIIDLLLKFGHVPVGMELWSADHIPTKERIQDELNKCDVHFLMCGSRYGSVSEDGISFTEWEYNLSRTQDRPIIRILLDEKEFEKATQGLTKLEQSKLRRFRKRLEDSGSLCAYYSEENEKELPMKCLNAVTHAVNAGKLKKDWGWVRADTELGQKVSAVQSEFMEGILDRVYSFSTLTQRLETESECKKVMGRLFWSLMLGRIKRAKFNDLFFESGSTLAYASSEFKRVLEASKAFDSRWKVTTNNVLTLLDYLLSTNVDVKPSPAGTPEDKYGAIFGDVLLRDPEAQPKFPRPLFPSEKDAVSETRETLQSDGNKRLYLMTASGIDLTHDEPAFRGPHVGSHPNALFKRAIFETGQPISLLLDAKKLEALFSFKVGECYPVFDGDVVWRDACHQYPLSLCIGYEHNGRDTGTAIRLSLIEMLEKSGDFKDFDFEYAYAEESEGGLLIVANSKFKEIFAEE